MSYPLPLSIVGLFTRRQKRIRGGTAFAGGLVSVARCYQRQAGREGGKERGDGGSGSGGREGGMRKGTSEEETTAWTERGKEGREKRSEGEEERERNGDMEGGKTSREVP